MQASLRCAHKLNKSKGPQENPAALTAGLRSFQRAEKAVAQAVEKAVAQAVEKAVAQAVEKTAEKAPEQAAEIAPEQTDGKADEK